MIGDGNCVEAALPGFANKGLSPFDSLPAIFFAIATESRSFPLRVSRCVHLKVDLFPDCSWVEPRRSRADRLRGRSFLIHNFYTIIWLPTARSWDRFIFIQPVFRSSSENRSVRYAPQ